MPGPITEAQKTLILARLQLGEPKTRIAAAAGVNRETVSRVAKANPLPESRAIVASTEIADRVLEEATIDLKEDFAEIVGLAVAAAKEVFNPDAEYEPNAVVATMARWAIDKLVPSADARETTRAAGANADAYSSMLAGLTADDDELRERMELVEEAQDEVVARRQPHIVNPPDAATA